MNSCSAYLRAGLISYIVDMVGISKKKLINYWFLSSLMDFRGGAIQFLGTKRHHDKWLRDSENYVIKGCFAMTELGHGSNVCEGCQSVGPGHQASMWFVRLLCYFS